VYTVKFNERRSNTMATAKKGGAKKTAKKGGAKKKGAKKR
jgi:hypothetical protein